VKGAALAAAMVLTIGSVIPYIRDILAGSTKPNIVSWMTWTLLGVVASLAQFAAGEPVAALFTAVVSLGPALVVAVGLRFGYVKYTRFDVACQVSALAGFGLWWAFSSPAVAVVAVVAINLAGALPTVRHAWTTPGEETWSAYALGAAGAALALFALTTYNWVSLPYAVYLVVINATLVGVLLARRSAAGARDDA